VTDDLCELSEPQSLRSDSPTAAFSDEERFFASSSDDETKREQFAPSSDEELTLDEDSQSEASFEEGESASVANSIPMSVSEMLSADVDLNTAMVFDLSELSRLHSSWCETFPRIQPFFAVKCNPDPVVIETLYRLGAGFDCASGQELKTVLSLGVSASSIIYANTVKLPKDLRYAQASGVSTMTCDSVYELRKIASNHPGANVFIRIKCGDPSALISFGDKFGSDEKEWAGLLKEAARLRLNIGGVSFHVGSGCSNAEAYEYAITQATKLLAMANASGFDAHVLDIGGGFSYPVNPDCAAMINSRVNKLDSSIRVIAEPGRFFVETVCTHYARVVGKRVRTNEEGTRANEYWVSDGIYGCFADVPHDYLKPVPHVVSLPGSHRFKKPSRLQETKIWGSTCDGNDVICKSVRLPSLEVGDWIRFPNMGAYTLVLATTFNSMNFLDIQRLYI